MFQGYGQFIVEVLGMKLTTLAAGLFGAFITMLRKTEGSIQARFFGYVIAIGTILYLVPALIWLFSWYFGYSLPAAVEHLGSFVVGLMAQTITENFADNPRETLFRWIRDFRKLKRALINGEALSTTKEPNETKETITEEKRG